MKLFYSPGACSLSPHIALREAGIPFELKKVSTKTHEVDGGGDFYAINPKGYVPLLELDDGEKLTEGPAIVQYIADQKPASGLAPACGTMGRYRVQEWLNFVTSELHKSFGPLFSADTPAEYKETLKKKIAMRYEWVDKQLAGKLYLTGDTFTVADGYLFTVTNWTKPLHIDLGAMPNLVAFQARVAARPAVQAAMKAEGLIK
jgi:glutathione S-transferase